MTVIDKRKKLLDCAIRLFARVGINQTTTADVARQAGVAAGTLFNYFPSKDDLIKSSYLECKLDLAKALGADIDFHASFELVLPQLWLQIMEWSLENLERHDFMKQLSHSPYTRDEVLQKRVKEEFCFLTNAFREAMEKGSIARMPPEYLDAILLSIFEGSVDYIRHKKKKEHPDLIQMSYEVVKRALGVKR